MQDEYLSETTIKLIQPEYNWDMNKQERELGDVNFWMVISIVILQLIGSAVLLWRVL